MCIVLGLENKVPDQDIQNFGIMVEGVRRSAYMSFDGPLTFNVIQTLYAGEPKPQGPTIDVVMLAKMPLQYQDDMTKNLVTVIPNKGKSVAIVRTHFCNKHPAITEATRPGTVTLTATHP